MIIFLAVVFFMVKNTSMPTEEVGENRAADEVSEEVSWATVTDPQSGVTFEYPEELQAKYIKVADWPPMVQVIDEEVACLEAGEEEMQAGKTEPRTIGGKTYCVTEINEGAAGSTYTMYAYGTPLGDKYAFFVFSTQAVQCGNYDKEEMEECESERNTFNIDPIIHQIISSAKY